MAKEKFDFIQPIKDIPKTLKGFPKNIITIVKEPVQNSEQVKQRRSEIYPYLYLFSGLLLIFLILSVAIPSTQSLMTTLAMIPGLLIIGCIFLLTVLKAAAKKFANLECTNCKKMITHDENVKYTVVKRDFTVEKEDKTITKNDIPVESTITVKGKERVVVEVTCKCQECGTEKSFTVDFVTMECKKVAIKIPYVQSGAMLVQYESDVRDFYASGAWNEVGTIHPTQAQAEVGGRKATDKEVNGVLVTYNRTIEDLIKGYFGNEIQMK